MISDLQKASMWKRASAFLLDAILLLVLATGFFWVIGTLTGYDGYLATVNEAYERIGAQYGITEEMQAKTMEELTPEERDAIQAANAAIAREDKAVHAYQMVANLQVIILAFGLLLAFLLLEFLVPQLLGNGQTLGKKIFGLAVMHTEGVRLRAMPLFIRTVLGKFAVETMPLAMTALFLVSGMGSPIFLLIALILLVVQIIVIIASRENALLHDKMAVTCVVDMASQMIFETHEDLLAYKQRKAAERAAATPY